LRDAMAVKVKNAFWIPAVRNHVWDGCIKFFRELSASFYTGLTFWVVQLLQKEDVEVEFVYEKLPTLVPCIVLLPTKVTKDVRFNYQEPIIIEAIRVKRGIVQASVNAGKTVIAMEIIRRLRLRTLYLVPSKELYKEALMAHKAYIPDYPLGQIKAGVFAPGGLTIAMSQSVVGHLRKETPAVLAWLKNIECVIADEVHKSGSEKWSKIFKEAKGAQYRYGLSGTPTGHGEVRDLTLIGLTGPLFGTISRKELVQRGLSVPTIVRFISYDKEGGSLDALKGRDFQDIYRLGIEELDERAMATWMAAWPHLEQGQRVAILVDTTDHGNALADVLRLAAGRKKMPGPQVLYGPHSDAQRRSILGAFRRGSRPLLITTLLKEGVNIPEMDVLFNAGGKRSETAVIQHGGRVHRTRKDKVLAYIYDYIDPAHEILLEHTYGRYDAYANDGYTIELITVEV
jgi:superfamily II DNA or RNA helicase